MKRALLSAVAVSTAIAWSWPALAQEAPASPAAPSSPAASAPAETASQPHVVHTAAAKFEAFPNMPDCFKGAVLHGDPATGPAIFIARSAAACRVPVHWHTPSENLMMVSGTARLAMKGQATETLRPNSYAFVPGHHQHQFTCPAACSFFVSSDGAFDIHYVDDTGKEITLEQALKAKAPAPAAPPKKTTP